MHGEEERFLGRGGLVRVPGPGRDDEEVARFLHSAEDLAKRTLQQNLGKLNTLAAALLERETLDDDEITGLIGPSVNESKERSIPVGPAQVASVRE